MKKRKTFLFSFGGLFKGSALESHESNNANAANYQQKSH